MRKWIVIAALVLVLLLPVAIGGAAIWLSTVDFRELAERKLSAALDRPVKIGALRIEWSDPLTLDIKDMSIANPAWAEPADMLTLGHAFARIDVVPLLHGTLRYERLDIDKLVVVLERDPHGAGNWKMGGGGPAMPGPAVVPKNRQQMPTLLDFTMTNSQIRYRTGSTQWLTVDISKSAVNTTGDDQPITLSAEGAYNNIPATLQLGGESFVKLRQADQPFGATFSVANDVNAINFHGTSMDPLDFDGMKGAMTINSKRLGALLKVIGADLPADLPFDIAGNFARSGDHWELDDAKGELGANTFSGAWTLDEGARGSIDHIGFMLDFDRLMVDDVIAHIGSGGGPADPMKTKLALPGKQSPEFKLQLSAGSVRFRKLHLADFHIAGAAGPGHISIDRVRFPFGGGTLDATASAKQQSQAAEVALSAALLGANITDFLKTLGIETQEITGKLDVNINLTGTGDTLGDLLARGNGEAVLAMRDGKVSRDVLEKASTDLRTIFRKGEGMSRVDCLLGIAEIRNGVATIAPLNLHSPDAKLMGGGTIDLKGRSIDLVIKPDPKSTGFFALDIPIHVSGPLAAPKAEPSSKAKLAFPAPMNLTPATRRLAQQSGCAS